MYKKLALLALLVSLCIYPAMAYTTEYTLVMSNGTSGSIASDFNRIYVTNTSFFQNATVVTMVGKAWMTPAAPLTATYAFNSSAGIVCDGTFSYIASGVSNFSADVSLTYVFNNITSVTPGAQYVTLVGVPGSPSQFAHHTDMVTLSATGDSRYNVLLANSIGGVSQMGGTTTVYSGEFVPSTPGANVTTTIHTIDANTGNHIIGSTVNAVCAGAATWTNTTTTDGKAAVTCGNTDLLDIYLSYPGVYSDVTDFSVPQGGDYYLAMYPITANATIGYTNIFLSVKDKDTGGYVSYASTTATLPSGAVTGDSTGSSGTTLFVVPNNSVIILGASKAGYTSMSKSLNSGTGANIATTIELSKSTVPSSTPTPTVTDPGTGLPITPVPTYLAYCNPNQHDYNEDKCSQSQDSSMMKQLRDWGPTILELCIVAILFWLLASVFQALYKMAGK